jgi:hypothetical protein
LEFAESGHLFWVFSCAKKEPLHHFSIMGHMVAYGSNAPQFVGHGRLLNLFFGSSQMDVWLPRYGHFKFWGGVVHKN